MTKKLLCITLMILVVASVMLTSCSSSEPTTTIPATTLGATESTPALSISTVNLGYFGTQCEAYLFVAYEKGFFKKYGIDINWVKISESTMGTLLSTGKVDTCMDMVVTWLKPMEEGLDIQITMGAHTGCIASIIKNDSTATNWTDLKGKTIGTMGTIGGTLMNYIFCLMIEEGLDPNTDFQWEVINSYQGIMDALDSGEIAAATCGDALKFAALDTGKYRVFTDILTDPAFAGTDCCVQAFSGQFIKDHPDTVKAFDQALVDACLYTQQNPAEAAQIMVDKKYVSGTVANIYRMIKTYDYLPGYDIGYRTMVNAAKYFIAGKILNGTSTPEAIAQEYMHDDGAYVYNN